jgi:hypothetical protein
MRSSHRLLGPAVLAAAASLVGCELSRNGLGDPRDPGYAAGANADPGDDDAGEPAACPTGGMHALSIEASVSWGGTGALDWTSGLSPGTGAMSLLALVETQAGRATLRACDATMPDVRSIAGTSHGGSFPDDIWERIDTRWPVSFRADCEQLGCAIGTELVEAQLGIELPARAPWPASPSEGSLRDGDDDGTPGVPFTLSTPVPLPSAGFGFVPWAASEAARQAQLADTLMLALRFEARLQGTLDSCTRASGTASELSLDAHVVSCLLQSGEPCSAAQASALDGSLPLWRITSASWQLVAVPDASCTSARSALPVPL